MSKRLLIESHFGRKAANVSSASTPKLSICKSQPSLQVSGGNEDGNHLEPKEKLPPASSGRSIKRARQHKTSPKCKVDDFDEFAGMDDDDIREIDETPFKSNSNNRISSASTLRSHNESSVLPHTSGLHENVSSNLEISRQKTLPEETDDEFAGIDDDDIRKIDETPFKNSTSSSTTPRSLLSTVMQLSSSLSSVARAANVVTGRKQQPKQYSTEGENNNNKESNLLLEESQTNIVTNLDSKEYTRDDSDDDDGEELDEKQNLLRSLSQLTQEEVDFDAMFESRDDVGDNGTAVDEASDEDDDSKILISDSSHPSESRELKQPTLSQYYTREAEPSRPLPQIAHFVEYNGRHFMKGDIWQHKAVPSETASNHECSNVIVKIKGFTIESVRGGKREKVAKIENKFYLPMEGVKWLGSWAANVIENRESNGRLGAQYVEYKLRTRCSKNSSTASKTTAAFQSSLHPIRLQMLHHQIKTIVTSDLIYGYDDGCSTKAGCFFKFNSSAVSEKKRMAIPKNREGRFTALELYSGAGGFSLGLKDAGFCVTHHVDNDTAACSTLQANFQDTEVLQYDVEDFLIGCLQNSTSRRYPKVGSITLLHGSSPCQGFSRANRNGGANDAANNAETYRFIDVVKHFQPPFVTFENVEGIADKKNRCYVQQMNAEFLKMEYQIRLCCITASDYGDPQNRNRIFILAAKKGLELPHLPRPTHGDDTPSLEKRKTVEDALGFLEDIPPLEYEGEVRAELNGRSLDLQGHKLRFAERNKDDIQLVAGNPAPTVIKKRVIRHYTNNKRPLTRLEHSLLQSFPPTYLFKGTDSEIRDQIGNAVPVCLARAIGRSVIEAIRRSGG